MKAMKTIPFSLKFLVFVLLFQIASVNAAATPQLRIESAFVADQTIFIEGQFDDSVGVTLYGIPLMCDITLDFTLLECAVPELNLEPGTYRLEVFIENTSNGNSVVTTDGTVKPTQFYGTLDVTLGVTGPQGLQGETGAAGTDGTNGTNGTDGTNGAQGPQGLQGETGIQGLPGEPRSGCILVPHGSYYGEIGVPHSIIFNVLGFTDFLITLGNKQEKGIYCNPVPGESCNQMDFLDFKFDCPVGHTWVQASALSKSDGAVHVTFTNLGKTDVGCGYYLTWYGLECQ